ncbi:MAG: XRE family transcriptional regulator [Clostridia bacterium]|nr:XRE family transcriptional regulator [Clostridia bacterium]
MNLGNKIKQLRKERNITIKELAEMTDLSIGFISNLERNQNSPSVANLQLICQALDINIVEFFESTKAPTAMVIRSDERDDILTEEGSPIKYELVVPDYSELNGICIITEGNSQLSKNSWGHSTDEVGLITEGTMEIHINNDIHTLCQGDTIYIPKNTPHKYRNPSSETSVSYWFSIKGTL